jgi:hypothetical protein
MTDNEFFMTRCLEGFWNDRPLPYVLQECQDLGMDLTGEIAKALNNTYRSVTTRIWLASNFRPVSNAMFNKRPITEVVAIWDKTPFVKQKPPSRPSSAYGRRVLQAKKLSGEAWAQGWLAQSDWKTVK